MRTTIELDDELREELVKEAAQRGERGYSSIINEALREYLENRSNRNEKLRGALDLRGSYDEDDEQQLRERIERAWTDWEW